jgi:hypothetical protein
MHENQLHKKILNALLYPPILVRFFRAFMFPAVVMTRHDLGERYYRNAILGRMLFCWCALLPMPLFIRGPLSYLFAIPLSLAALFWFVRCDRQCRREIKQRKLTGAPVHSHSMGVPRFGLKNEEQINTVTLPLRLLLAGIICFVFSASLGAYLGCAAMGIYAEAAWRRQLAREAALDAQDANLAIFVPSDRDEAATPQSQAPIPHSTTANPLAGFENVLAETNQQ